MRLRAEIIVEMNPEDFLSAAEHQRRLQGVLETIQQDYPHATLEFRQRRPRASEPSARTLQLVKNRTGRLNRYEDA